jgi:hypothetical protein
MSEDRVQLLLALQASDLTHVAIASLFRRTRSHCLRSMPFQATGQLGSRVLQMNYSAM